MTGLYPTVGCFVILNQMPVKEAKKDVLARLHSLIVQNSEEKSGTETRIVLAMLAATHLEAIIYAQEAAIGICVFINFDEEQVVHLARQTGLNIDELLSPYVAALETVAGCKGIGIGFELSPPLGTDNQRLMDAGISQYFSWDQENTRWNREKILPMIGHFL